VLADFGVMVLFGGLRVEVAGDHGVGGVKGRRVGHGIPTDQQLIGVGESHTMAAFDHSGRTARWMRTSRHGVGVRGKPFS